MEALLPRENTRPLNPMTREPKINERTLPPSTSGRGIKGEGQTSTSFRRRSSLPREGQTVTPLPFSRLAALPLRTKTKARYLPRPVHNLRSRSHVRVVALNALHMNRSLDTKNFPPAKLGSLPHTRPRSLNDQFL